MKKNILNLLCSLQTKDSVASAIRPNQRQIKKKHFPTYCTLSIYSCAMCGKNGQRFVFVFIFCVYILLFTYLVDDSDRCFCLSHTNALKQFLCVIHHRLIIKLNWITDLDIKHIHINMYFIFELVRFCVCWFVCLFVHCILSYIRL